METPSINHSLTPVSGGGGTLLRVTLPPSPGGGVGLDRLLLLRRGGLLQLEPRRQPVGDEPLVRRSRRQYQVGRLGFLLGDVGSELAL